MEMKNLPRGILYTWDFKDSRKGYIECSNKNEINVHTDDGKTYKFSHPDIASIIFEFTGEVKIKRVYDLPQEGPQSTRHIQSDGGFI